MKVQLIENDLLVRLVQEARQKERLRTNHNFHQDLSENPNRFLNVMIQGTYIAPHHHSDPPKSESFVMLEGEVAFFLFEKDGRICDRYDLSAAPGSLLRGIDIGPGIYHSIVVLSPHAICFEVKPGPYAAVNDKAFASWAPRENEPGIETYVQSLLAWQKNEALSP
ncbi:MAG: WbuC family cupin fold metalloprotein [Spirochaetales bacterium]|nr:WbuC family cupin fold metalloprotein [Spirochaetales bacterium]